MKRRDFLKLGSLLPGVKVFGLPKLDRDWDKHTDLIQSISGSTDERFGPIDVVPLSVWEEYAKSAADYGDAMSGMALSLQQATNAQVAGSIIEQLDPEDFDTVAQFAECVREIVEAFDC